MHNSQHSSNVGTPHCLKVKGICVTHFSALISISLLCPCQMVLLVASLRSRPHLPALCQDQQRPQPPWVEVEWTLVSPFTGVSGCLANPTPHTGFEPNFYSYMNEEHTPINLPDSHRSFPCRDDATIITTTEDPEGFPQTGASSSSKQTAASRVPRTLGSSFACLWKQWRDHVSVDRRTGIQETGASLDRESVAPATFSSRREILTSIFMRSITNLNLSDFY